MKVNKEAVAFRYGQLVAGLAGARSALGSAGSSMGLLSDDDCTRMKHIIEMLAGIEQRAWSLACPPRRQRQGKR